RTVTVSPQRPVGGKFARHHSRPGNYDSHRRYLTMSGQETKGPASGFMPGFGGAFPMAQVVQENLKALRDSWFWFVLLGALLIVLGFVVLSYDWLVWATLVTAVVFGYFMVIGGIFYIVGAFFTRGWGGFFLSLFAGVLNLGGGGIFIDRPVGALVWFTL